MLRFLSRAEEEVRQQHPEDTQLYLDFYSGGQPARVEIQQTRQNIADKLQMSGAEVAGVLRELAAHDYIDLHCGWSGVSAIVTMRQKGCVALWRSLTRTLNCRGGWRLLKVYEA